MPTPPSQPAVYPPTLLVDSTQLKKANDLAGGPDAVRRWWAVYTRARQEKTLARKLYANKIPFYLPLVPHQYAYQEKRIESHIPLFSNYLFLFATNAERNAALKTNCTARMLPVADSVELHQDLLNLYQLIDADVPLTLEQQIRAGCGVEVTAGTLKGLQGIEVPPNRLQVAVTYLQQAVSIEIEDMTIETIETI